MIMEAEWKTIRGHETFAWRPIYNLDIRHIYAITKDYNFALEYASNTSLLT